MSEEEQCTAGLDRLQEYLGTLAYDGNLGEICIIINPDGLFIEFEGKKFKVEEEGPEAQFNDAIRKCPKCSFALSYRETREWDSRNEEEVWVCTNCLHTWILVEEIKPKPKNLLQRLRIY